MSPGDLLSRASGCTPASSGHEGGMMKKKFAILALAFSAYQSLTGSDGGASDLAGRPALPPRSTGVTPAATVAEARGPLLEPIDLRRSTPAPAELAAISA